MRRRNANGSGTIVRRADGRWEGKYTVGRTAEGKQKRRSVYGKTQAECRKKLEKAIYEYDEGISHSSSVDMTVQTWLETWIECYKANQLKPLTLDKYRQDLRLYIYPYIGMIHLKNLSTEQIQVVYNELSKTRSAKTIENVHAVFNQALKKARKLGYIRINPCEECELPKKTKVIQNVLTKNEEIRAFIEELKDNRYRNPILFDLFTGLRIGELLGLTWDCIDFENNLIVINKQLRRSTHGKGGYYVLDSTKTNKIRTICITPSAINILKHEKEKQEHWRELNGNDWQDDMNLVFTDEFGKHLCHYTVYRNFKNVVSRIGRCDLRFHDLRHSYATICLEEGGNIKVVQGNLGHEKAETTLNTYSHPTTQMQIELASNLERRFKCIQSDDNSRQDSRQGIAKPPETQ